LAVAVGHRSDPGTAAPDRDGRLDLERVRALLGRDPAGDFEVVVRDGAGGPVVIRNAPLLSDGQPMPTRYWLVGRREVIAVSRLEATGGVRAAEAAVDPVSLQAAHDRYAAERDASLADLPPDRPRPSGGVGGTQRGVKCLHAHYAWHLAGGDDPVGRWVADQLLGQLDVEIEPDRVLVHHHTETAPLGVTPRGLVEGGLTSHDPPDPADLTNALGAVADALDAAVRERPAIVAAVRLGVRGYEGWHLAQVERGCAEPGPHVTIGRDELEDLFRTLATEGRDDRVHNPACDPLRVDTVVATCCIVLAVMRRLALAEAVFAAPDDERPEGGR
jgi:hypothetical protein